MKAEKPYKFFPSLNTYLKIAEKSTKKKQFKFDLASVLVCEVSEKV